LVACDPAESSNSVPNTTMPSSFQGHPKPDTKSERGSVGFGTENLSSIHEQQGLYKVLDIQTISLLWIVQSGRLSKLDAQFPTLVVERILLKDLCAVVCAWQV